MPLSTLHTILAEPAPVLPDRHALLPDSNHVLHMDNLEAIARVPVGSLDFVYIDPPFASAADYKQKITVAGRELTRTAYTDTWPDGLAGYLRFLVPRLRAITPLLSPTGSICVHLDSHSSHYIKIALDAILGAETLINEVIWRYGKMSNTSRRFPRNHDTLLVYGATTDWYFQPLMNQPSEYRTRFLRDLTGNQLLYGTVKLRTDKLILRRIAAIRRELGRDLEDDDVLFDFDTERKLQDDVFTDISIIRGNANEGVGYPTQKPRKLLERLINAYCPDDGTVADFFCGSGTTAVAAHALGRRFVVSDIAQPAITATRERLGDAPYTFTRFGDVPTFTVTPDGDILDFRVHELGLTLADARYIEELVRTNSAALLVRTGRGWQDVFGREATVYA